MSWFIGGPLIYFAVVVFLVKTLATVRKYHHMPRHLRWDLYPVPHQEPEGSKYQKVDFANLPPHVSLLHELKAMSQEMLFIKKAFVNNPKVWWGSFPLHAGLYLGALWLVMLLVGGVLEMGGQEVTANSPSAVAAVVYYLTEVAGVLGFVAGFLGSLILLWRRITDEALRDISDRVSYLNLGLLLLLFGTGLLAWWLVDPSFQVIRFHAASLLLLNPSKVAAPLVILEMFAFCLFLLYLPFSRMMHFVGKYFFYHNIMWDDALMKPGSLMEKDIAAYLQYEVTWAAPHIRQKGSWVKQVTAGPPKEGEKR